MLKQTKTGPKFPHLNLHNNNKKMTFEYLLVWSKYDDNTTETSSHVEFCVNINNVLSFLWSELEAHSEEQNLEWTLTFSNPVTLANSLIQKLCNLMYSSGTSIRLYTVPKETLEVTKDILLEMHEAARKQKKNELEKVQLKLEEEIKEAQKKLEEIKRKKGE